VCLKDPKILSRVHNVIAVFVIIRLLFSHEGRWSFSEATVISSLQ
jgi:hypothetical protein